MIFMRYRLVNKYMCELLVLHFSKRIALINCLSVSFASIALIDILNAFSPSLKNLSNSYPGADIRIIWNSSNN
jgi:hypothetical protein